ncbi:DUF2207 domain-containing protein [Parasphingorhabdus pacifica]
MLTKRVPKSIVALLGAMVAVGTPEPAFAQDEPPGSLTTELDLKLERDGLLSVTERITVPDGEPVHRAIPLRLPDGSAEERVFSVEDVRIEGNGDVHTDGDELDLTVRPGVSTLTYAVRGAVADVPGAQQVRWQVTGGWDTTVGRVEMSSFLSPQLARSIECFAGETGSRSRCDSFEIGHTQSVRVTTRGLAPQDRVDVRLRLPVGAVPANAVVKERFDPADAFSLNAATGAGLAGIGLLLIGSFGLLWYARGRDERIAADEVGPVEVLLTDSAGGVTFASPDGVLPGQVGTVLDEHVDVIDVVATVLDLVVRNYLHIEEETDGRDWRLVRLNPPDDALRPYERAVYEALLGERSDVRISRLREQQAGPDVTGIRAALYADVVQQAWFRRRPDSERDLFWWVGVGIALGGGALTVLLALTGSLALLGAGLVLGGIAFALGARVMPARTARGGALVAQVNGLREYLRAVDPQAIPAADREMVFSRSLPYAVALGEAERWLEKFAGLDPGADGTPGLHWYGEPARGGATMPNLRRFRERFPRLLAELDVVLTSAGGLRS